MAEVEIIKTKGEAKAIAMSRKAEAFKMYNDAAVTQMIIDKLPEIAQAIASPLAKTEKIVIIDNVGGDGQGKGATKVTGYITDIMSTLPETVEALTGMNVMDLLKNISSKVLGSKNTESVDSEK
jgi:flotillin